MSTIRPLGVGSQELLHGDRMAGYYGEVNNLITADELRNITGVEQGTPMQTEDINWLKFSHNYKTLYIAEKPIQHSISWDYLHERDLVFGRTIEIGGKLYLLRLMQGSNINPSINYNGSSPESTITEQNSEWDKLLVPLVNIWGVKTVSDLGIDSSYGSNTICQEVHSHSLNARVARGRDTLGDISSHHPVNSYDSTSSFGWRPVLELLMDFNEPPQLKISTNNNLMITGTQTSFSLTGKVWDKERNDTTVSVTIGNVTKSVLVTNPPSEEPFGDNFSLNFDVVTDEIADGAYNNLIFKAVDSKNVQTNVTWEYTVTVGAGAYINIYEKKYPKIKWDIQNPANNELTKLELKVNGVVRNRYTENIEALREVFISETELNEGENTITLELYYGTSNMSFVDIKATKSPLQSKLVNTIDLRYNISGQVNEIATWLEHRAEMEEDFTIDIKIKEGE